MIRHTGHAFVFGDNINTDYIISSRRKKDTINPDELVPYLMEDIRPDFSSMLKETNVIAAGDDFGCGSAMEVAAQVMKSAGVPFILAKSFARSYFRNAINNGIIPVEMDTDSISEGDQIQLEMDDTRITVTNFNTGQVVTRPAFTGQLRDILVAGGLIPYMRNKNVKAERGEPDERKN